jgi:hypothetical protein
MHKHDVVWLRVSLPHVSLPSDPRRCILDFHYWRLNHGHAVYLNKLSWIKFCFAWINLNGDSRLKAAWFHCNQHILAWISHCAMVWRETSTWVTSERAWFNKLIQSIDSWTKTVSNSKSIKPHQAIDSSPRNLTTLSHWWHWHCHMCLLALSTAGSKK